MNKARRDALQKISDKIEDLKGQLESLTYEEAEYRDNIPENLQGTEKYEKADTAVSALEEAMENLESAVENIESAME